MSMLKEGESITEAMERFGLERERVTNIWCPYCDCKQSQETITDHVTYWGEPHKDEDELCYCEECGKKFRVKENVERTFETEI